MRDKLEFLLEVLTGLQEEILGSEVVDDMWVITFPDYYLITFTPEEDTFTLDVITHSGGDYDEQPTEDVKNLLISGSVYGIVERLLIERAKDRLGSCLQCLIGEEHVHHL